MRTLETFDLNLLLLLDWLLKEKSVTRAAERMGVTQPAASRSLQRLRDAFGDELLVRTGRTYTLSRFAASLQPDLAAAIAQLRTVSSRKDDFDPATASDTISIACNDYLADLGVRAWHDQIGPHAPSLTPNWRPLDAQVGQLLASGGVDMVFAPYAAQPNMPSSAVMQDMVVKPLLEDRFVLFGRGDHTAFDQENLSLETFCDLPQILVSPQGRGGGIVDQRLSERNLKRRIIQRTYSFRHAAGIALLTDAVAVLPERFARLFPEGSVRTLPLDLDPLPSFIAWHASRTSDPAHQWVRGQLQRYFEGGSE